jgi:hypothetical protein
VNSIVERLEQGTDHLANAIAAAPVAGRGTFAPCLAARSWHSAIRSIGGAGVAALDPGDEVLGRERLDEEGIEHDVVDDWRRLRRGEDQRHTWTVRANVSSKLKAVCERSHP